MTVTATSTKEHIKTYAPKTDGSVFHNDIAETTPCLFRGLSHLGTLFRVCSSIIAFFQVVSFVDRTDDASVSPFLGNAWNLHVVHASEAFVAIR